MSESALLFLAYCLIQLAPDRYLLSLRKMWHEMFHEDVQTCQHKKLQNCWAVRVRVHCWLMDRPFSAEPFHLAGLQPALVQGAISPRVEDSLFLFIKCHDISPGTFLQPLDSLSMAAQTKWLGPSFPPDLYPTRLWQAGPWMGQNEGQLLVLLLGVQSLCCMRSSESVLVRSSQNATQQLQAISQKRSQKKEFCCCCHWIFYSPDWFCAVSFQANAKQFNLWRTSDSWGEVWLQAKRRNWGKSYMGVCASFPGGKFGLFALCCKSGIIK